MDLYFNIVLVAPEIPNNTGNIGRIAVATQSRLHLIEPFGFELTDARVKRAGLDYWQDLDLVIYPTLEAWYEQIEDPSRVFFFTAREERSFYDLKLQKGDWFVFGKESQGLGTELLERFKEQVYTLPFPGKVRSFNVANTVSMVVGEGLRQLSH